MAGRSVTLTTTGGPVLVLFSGSHYMSAAGSAAYWRIVRDDSTIVADNTRTYETGAWTTTTLFGVDEPPAGEHTYKVRWHVAHATHTLYASAGVYSENFAAIEFKR